jgi:hypothetical protein
MRRAVLDCRRNLDENRLGEQAKTGGWLRLAAVGCVGRDTSRSNPTLVC